MSKKGKPKAGFRIGDLIVNLGPLPGPERIETPEALYAAMLDWAADWYAGEKRHAEHPWRMVVLFDNQTTRVYRFGPAIPDKQVIFQLHQHSIQFPGATCVALICEAYGKHVSKDEEFKGLADDPEAFECVLFNLLTRERQALMMCKLDRTGSRGATFEQVPFCWLDEDGRYSKTEGRAIRGGS